ncbi:hypothetical protein EGI16_06900 [Chryseobacterium sp. G0240]|nr:hypothetical protein EGI16_06900 [Chryseobacterium sp. G0240]
MVYFPNESELDPIGWNMFKDYKFKDLLQLRDFKSATKVPQTFGVFLKIRTVAINKKILNLNFT